MFIVGHLFIQGSGALDMTFIITDPLPSFDETLSGGIRTPIIGTLLMMVMSTAFVLLPALGTAIYLAEYLPAQGRLTAAIRLGLEVLAGVPSVVFGMFGLAFFSLAFFAVLSSTAEGVDSTLAFGRSFIIASIVTSLFILPFVITVMEEAIRSVPRSYRDAGLALGLSKWRTVSRIVLPAARPGLTTAVILGMGLIAGDTAIVMLTLGGTMTMTAGDAWWEVGNWWETLTGTGSTMTTFIHYSSPAGEGNSPGKAYGAALLLVLVVLGFNAAVALLGRSRRVRNAHTR